MEMINIKIGLIDVDSHNFPNLCLMKLSAYHKSKGDEVYWYNSLYHYDIVYKSRIFDDTYSKDFKEVINSDCVVKGGTGYGLLNKLSNNIEHIFPDYSIYPQFQNTAYGFLSRGCPRNCGFCIVSEKEGQKSIAVANIGEFWNNQKEIKLMDANLLACSDCEKLLLQLVNSKAWVDFTQGLDIRLISKDNISLLNKIKIKRIHFAWDNPREDLIKYFEKFSEYSKVQDIRKRSVYILCNHNSTHEEDLYRINTLKKLNYSPYVMIYNKPSAPQVTKNLARWVNNRRIFFSVANFEDFKP